MRVKVTEIEATAEELRQSTSLSQAFTDILRRSFIGMTAYGHEETEEQEEEE